MRHDNEIDRDVEKGRREERRRIRERYDSEAPGFDQSVVLEETLVKMGGPLVDLATRETVDYLPRGLGNPALPRRARSDAEQKQLDEAAYHLRTLGLTYRQMSQRLYVSPSAARGRVKRHIHRQRTPIEEHVADIRMMDLDMLRLLTQAHSIPAIHGNRTAGRMMLQIIAQRHRLLKDERLPTQEALLKMSQEALIPGYDDAEIDREDVELYAEWQARQLELQQHGEEMVRRGRQAGKATSPKESASPGRSVPSTLPQPLPEREGSIPPALPVPAALPAPAVPTGSAVPTTSPSSIAPLIVALLAPALIALTGMLLNIHPAPLFAWPSLELSQQAGLARGEDQADVSVHHGPSCLHGSPWRLACGELASAARLPKMTRTWLDAQSLADSKRTPSVQGGASGEVATRCESELCVIARSGFP